MNFAFELYFKHPVAHFKSEKSLFQGCLFHAQDTCPDCMFAQLCGENQKTNQCNFMKHSELKKRVEENTAEIKGNGYSTISKL